MVDGNARRPAPAAAALIPRVTENYVFISDFAIKRPIVTVVTMLALVAFGIARTTNVARWWTGTPVDPRPLLRR